MNKIDGKIYIGKTIHDLEYRKRSHFEDASANRGYYFHRALCKYGVENFDWQVIDEAATEQELNEKEKYWIQFYKSFDPQFGYNLTMGGDGGLVVAAVREKIRKSHIGVSFTNDRKKKMSDALKGREITAEWRERISNSMKGKQAWNKGIPHSDETRQKISAAKKGKSLKKGGEHV